MEIAIYLGPDGETAPLQEEGEIKLFQYNCGVWEISRSMPFCLGPSTGLRAMREYMQTILDFLGECRTFVGLSVTGLPFYELEKAGVNIWEIAGSSYNVLNSILQAGDEPAPSPPDTIALIPVPTAREISPGRYYISLKEIQNCNGQVTSKTVLLPLLQHMNFQTLEVTCNHIPPWLEEQILSDQIKARVDKLDNQDISITICGANSAAEH